MPQSLIASRRTLDAVTRRICAGQRILREDPTSVASTWAKSWLRCAGRKARPCGSRRPPPRLLHPIARVASPLGGEAHHGEPRHATCVIAVVLSPAEQKAHHDHADPHVRGRWLSDFILGAQDGLVNTLGIVLGVAAASASARVTLAAGLAAGVAEALSMAAVAYTSSVARGELFRSERDREYRHIAVTPAIERAEIRNLYSKKGFRGPLLDRIVDTICANKDVWVAVMMAEEHGLVPIDRRASLRSAALVGAASFAGAIVPVVPFAALARGPAVAASLALGSLGLFALGAFKARVTVSRPLRSGASLALIGMLSAVAGYLVGTALGVAP